MSRKTVDIDDLKARINDTILHGVDDDKSGRFALATLLSTVLHDAGQYKGFGYLTPDMMKHSNFGTTIGVDHNRPEGERFTDTVHTRIFYY